jgi:hypothetical protein
MISQNFVLGGNQTESTKLQALPNPQYYIKNSNEKREKKKKKVTHFDSEI